MNKLFFGLFLLVLPFHSVAQEDKCNPDTIQIQLSESALAVQSPLTIYLKNKSVENAEFLASQLSPVLAQVNLVSACRELPDGGKDWSGVEQVLPLVARNVVPSVLVDQMAIEVNVLGAFASEGLKDDLIDAFNYLVKLSRR